MPNFLLRALLSASIIALPGHAFAASENGAEMDKNYSALERVMQQKASRADDVQAMYFLGYVSGIADTLVIGETICLPAGTNNGQLAMIAGKYNRDFPAMWHINASTIITAALISAFKCKK